MANAKTEAASVNDDLLHGAFTEANGRAKQAIEKSARLVQELTELAKGNVEAIVASSKVAATGFESLGREAADYGRRSFEEASAALQTFTTVKSPTDLFQLQSEYARSAFGSLFAQSTKLSDTVVELSGQIAGPLANRYVAAAERVKTAAFEG